MNYVNNMDRLENLRSHWIVQRKDGRFFRLSASAGFLLTSMLPLLDIGEFKGKNERMMIEKLIALDLVRDPNRSVMAVSGQTKNVDRLVILLRAPMVARWARELSHWTTTTLIDVLSALALICLIIYVVVGQNSLINSHGLVLPDFKLSLASLFVYVLSVVIHELGHAVYCVKFAGSVGDVLIGFRSGLPMIMTDTSVSYFSSRIERVRVSLAGLQFQLIFVACFVGIFHNFEPRLSSLMGSLMIVTVWFVLVPFTRNDGFWILSDLANEPSPMHSAWARVRSGKAKRIDCLVILLISSAFISTWTIILYILTDSLTQLWLVASDQGSWSLATVLFAAQSILITTALLTAVMRLVKIAAPARWLATLSGKLQLFGRE